MFLLSACSSDPRTSPDTGVPNTDAGLLDTGIPDSGTDSSTVGFQGPLLEQSGTNGYACASERFEKHDNTDVWLGYDYATNDAGASWFARIDGLRTDPFSPPTSSELRLHPVALDGTLEPSVLVPGSSTVDRRELSASSIAENLLLVWVESGQLQSLLVAPSGDIVSGPHSVAIAGLWTRDVRVVAGATGALVVWATASAQDDRTELMARALDQSGAPSAPAQSLHRSEQSFTRIVADVVEVGDGYAVFYSSDQAENPGAVLQRVDRDGVARGDAVSFAADPTGFFSHGGGALIRLDEGFIAAWPKLEVMSGSQEESSVMLQLARLDDEGRVLGKVVPLKMPELHIEHVEPELFWFNDQVALTWGLGDIIYICGGCVPNHTVKLVLIDPEALVPSSPVATLESPSIGGGLLERRHAVVGDLVMTASRVVYHVHHDVADGAFRCVAN